MRHKKVMGQHPGKAGSFISRLTPPGGGVRTSIKREFRNGRRCDLELNELRPTRSVNDVLKHLGDGHW